MPGVVVIPGAIFLPHRHNLCFAAMCASILGPFIVQYSSQMNMIYKKQMFAPHKFSKYGFFKRAYLISQLTCIGLVLTVATDILFKVQNVADVLSLVLCCGSRKKRNLPRMISLCLQKLIDSSLEMTDFEVENYREQSLYTQVIFEDFIMAFVYHLVIFDAVDDFGID